MRASCENRMEMIRRQRKEEMADRWREKHDVLTGTKICAPSSRFPLLILFDFRPRIAHSLFWFHFRNIFVLVKLHIIGWRRPLSMKHRGAVKQPFHLGHHCTSIFFRHTHTQSAIVFKYAPNRRQTHGLQCRRRRRQHDTPLFTLKFSLESNCVLRYLLTRLQCTGE